MMDTGSSNLLSEQLPWVEKYRPKDLSGLLSHHDITSTIQRFVNQDKLPHLLFYGPPGTGKTSTILAIAKQMYGPRYKSMILELNASDDRGINVVRNQIKSFASTKTIFSSGVKLIILDEADAMTNAAQAALRRVIEKYTKNVRFCLICNYVSKIIPAIQSRCTSFRFSPIPATDIEERLCEIADVERVNLDESGRTAILRLCGGDMRRVLNILQASSMAQGNLAVDEDCIYSCTGQPKPKDVAHMVDLMMNQPYSVAFKEIRDMNVSKGYAIQDIITSVHVYASKIVFPAEIRVFLLEELSNAECRLAMGANESIQLAGLVSIFVAIRERVSKMQAS